VNASQNGARRRYLPAVAVGGPVCVEHRVPLAYCPHGSTSQTDPEPAGPEPAGAVAARPRWSPARLAYAFYAVAASGAVAGQVWVALSRIDWSPAVPVAARALAVLPFAACIELLAMALAAMGDERMRAGERAYGFRAFSAVVAVLAVGILVVGHAPHLYLVGAFGLLSTSAYLLWLLHSAARRRDALRAAGRLATVAPAYGWYRRLRHPVVTARAAELARERGLGLYASLRAAELELRAEARRPAIAAAVEQVVRADHADPRMAQIAVATLDLDRVAGELESRADYAGWADRLAPAVLADRPAPPAGRDTTSSTSPAGSGVRRRAAGGKRGTAERVAAARQRHPEATKAELAKYAKVSLRTAIRHDPARTNGSRDQVAEVSNAAA